MEEGNQKKRIQRKDFDVTIVNCRSLRAADFSFVGKGKSDPFCRLHVLGRPSTKVETPHMKKTLDPDFKFNSKFMGVKEGDFLEFEVYDYDMLSSPDLLGKCTLPFHMFSNGLDEDVPLEETEGAPSTVRLRIKEIPKDITEEPEVRCFVKVISAHNLRSADFMTGKSDPYTTVEVPGKPKSRFQTKVLWRNLEPVWDEEDELEGYAEDDNIKFEVWDYDVVGKPDSLGYCTIDTEDFHPLGFTGRLPLENCGGKNSYIMVQIEVDCPPEPPEPIDPLEHVMQTETQRVPFQLRSLETNRIHPLRGYTRIGRSRKLLDPEMDLIIDSRTSGDVSRIHGHVKACLLPDSFTWLLRVYNGQGGGGLGAAEGGGHAGTGTSVDGDPVDADIGHPIRPGSIIRFGKNELWVLECCSLCSKSERAAAAQGRAAILEEDDPLMMRDLHIGTVACHDAIQSCTDWISIVRVSLEWLAEPDEPPCVDCIEVTDELRRTASIHPVSVFEEQQTYDVRKVLRDVRLGTTLRLRLCSDPFLLAPILSYLDELQNWTAGQMAGHKHE